MVLMLLGIGLFGAITATITSYFLTNDLRRVEAKVEADVALDQTDLALDRTTARWKRGLRGSSPNSKGWRLSTAEAI